MYHCTIRWYFSSPFSDKSYLKTMIMIFQAVSPGLIARVEPPLCLANAKKIRSWLPNNFFTESTFRHPSQSAEKISAKIHESENYQLCPHSAVGVAAQIENPSKVIVAGTAHPGKFEEKFYELPKAHYNLNFEGVSEQEIIPADYETIVQQILDFASYRAFRGAHSGPIC